MCRSSAPHLLPAPEAFFVRAEQPLNSIGMIFLWRRQAITTASIHLDQSLPHKLRLML
jgi:hypothetical protein